MSTHYRQLTMAQRYQIWCLRDTGYKLRAIGAKVGVDFSTVSRELRRNCSIDGYEPELAHKKSTNRKTTANKLSKSSIKLKSIIEKGLCLGWSPDAISQRMKLEDLPDHERLSHASIYRYIEKDKQQGGGLYRQLPRFGKTRWRGGKRNRQAGTKLIPGRVDITERPAIVDTRSRLGDWEGDTVYGKSAHLVTLVERKSRFTLAKRVTSKCKEEVGDALIELLGKVAAKTTLTLDNGGEFADQIRVSKVSKVAIYFAKPYASWQRGTNENTNGRIRRFWPKKFDIGTLADEEIEEEIFNLNCTPRKILSGLTPLEVFTGLRVALIA
jgi:IS30 family transposase